MLKLWMTSIMMVTWNYSDDISKHHNGVLVKNFNSDIYLYIAAIFQMSNILAIHLGYENESFAPVITYWIWTDSQPSMLTVSDFNDGNQMDIAVSKVNADSFTIFLEYGDESFVNWLHAQLEILLFHTRPLCLILIIIVF